MPGTLWILIGPKGAGKTHLGGLLEARRGIPFLRVEPIFLEVIEEAGTRNDVVFGRAFQRVVETIGERLSDGSSLVIESTATWPRFGEVLDQLRARHDVRIVAVRAPLEECIRRVHARDAAAHIPVSDDELARINAVGREVDLPTVGELDNRRGTDDDALLRQWDALAERAG